MVTRPFKQLIDAKGAASLPITGGKASASSGKHRVPDLSEPNCASLPMVVSIESALTECSGTLDDDGVYRTHVTTTVEGLNVGDTVTADRVTAKLVTEHYPDEDEPRIDVSDSSIENLMVLGQPVQLEFDTPLFQGLNTFSKFKTQFDKDPKFKKEMRQRFLWGDLPPNEVPDFLAERYKFTEGQPSLPESKGIVPCSVIKSVTGSKGFQTFRHVLVIPDFGKVFLGELLLRKHARRLTMMRFQLGSPMAAALTVSGNEGNGTTYP
jgi:hypothetical protein